MICGIYFILNTKTSKIYIGSSNNVGYRIYKHTLNLKNNTHPNEHLQRAFSKYGEKHFTYGIIIECNENRLDKVEQYYIDTTKCYTDKIGYNKSRNTIAFMRGLKFTPKHRKAISEGLISRPFNSCKPLSQEHKDNISKSNTGKVRTSEMNARQFQRLKGKVTWMKNKKHRPESIILMKKSHKGHIPWNKGLHTLPHGYTRPFEVGFKISLSKYLCNAFLKELQNESHYQRVS